jgi:D-3-phosphoglycerate dehydrogenase
MPHILVAGRIHDAGLALLRAAPGVTLDVVDEVSPDAYLPFIEQADAILIRTQPLRAAAIARAGRLAMVSRHGVGYDSIDVAALSARGIPLAIVGDVNSRSVAEHTLMLMLALAKRALAHDAATRSGDWTMRDRFEATELAGKTLFVIGFGRIGRRVARLAQAFDMTIAAFDPVVGAGRIEEAGAAPVARIDDGLGVADFVTLHMPLSGAPLIGAEQLARMKPTAMIINTARGGLVDETALADALAAGRIAGAGLDVFAAEPPPRASRLLADGRIILSPHNAGLTGESAARMAIFAAQNILDFFAGVLDRSLVVNAGALEARDPGRPA